MKQEIVSKLTELLWKTELSEPETLYVLVQIRKLSEHLNLERNHDKYSTLFFYCDWAVHAKLERASAKKVLHNLYANWRSKESVKFISFETFKEQLGVFLSQCELPDHIVTDQERWFEFRRNLIQILIDIPLEGKGPGIIKFSLLNMGLKPADEYLLSYRAEFDNGDTEKWNVVLADFGPKRHAILREENASFLKKFRDKVRYRREIAERNHNLPPKRDIR